MSYARVQTSGKQNYDNTTASAADSRSMPGSFTSGNKGIFTLELATPAGATVTATVVINGVTATRVSRSTPINNGFGYATYSDIYLAEGLTGGSATYAVTFSGTGTYAVGACSEVSGLDTPAFDVQAVNTTSTSTSSSVTSPTLSQADEFVVACFAHGTGNITTVTPPAGFTVEFSENDGTNHAVGGAAGKVVAVTTAVTALFTTTDSEVQSACVASFKIAAGGGGPAPTAKRRALLGVGF